MTNITKTNSTTDSTKKSEKPQVQKQPEASLAGAMIIQKRKEEKVSLSKNIRIDSKKTEKDK